MSNGGAYQRSKSITRFKKPVTTSEDTKMTPEQTTRYLAFADPSNPKVKAMLASALMKDRKVMGEEDKEAEDKKLIGILKAAEARNRLRNARLQYQHLRRGRIEEILEDETGEIFIRRP
ncbi:hypothetical protein JD844_019152 [Phrynosoma platyrhinos]|uniref:Uncharacterized protein n=1 Tax=Phrynosoma platyrhinos TaxID=52577 RepID=A0ABQ7SPN5_PHRPL|nr:hypothetical protein JD844_019152 [Phrynosoma platyrhinos]